MALCNVTGTLYLPDGSKAYRYIIYLQSAEKGVVADYLGSVIPAQVQTFSTSDGSVDFSILSGVYRGVARSVNGVYGRDYQFTFTVPDAPSAKFEDCIADATTSPQVPGWLQQALAYKNDAEAAAAAATAAAEGAATDAANLVGPALAESIRAEVAADADRAQAAALGLADQAETVAELKLGQKKVRTVAGATPKIIDGDVVILWEKNGKLHGPGIGESGGGSAEADMAAVRSYAQPRQSPRASNLPIFTDGRTLARYRGAMGKLMSGDLTAIPRIVFDGDSWAGMNQIATVLRDRIGQDYPLAGYGWWPAVAGARFGNPGAGYARTGSWTYLDVTNTASAIPNPLPDGSGIDGHLLYTTGSDAQALITKTQMSELRIYTRNHGGTWRYSVDGGSPTVVTDSNDGALKITTISGLNPTGNNNITIDTVGNTGKVAIAGFYLSKPAPGVEIIQSGNGGSMGLHWSLIAPNIRAIAEDIKPDLRITVLGTNDYRYVSGVESYIQGIRDARDAYRLAAPDMGFIFISPAQSAGIPLMTPQSQLRDALYEFCVTEGHEFYNMTDDWPTYAVSNAQGLWADTAHLSAPGQHALVSRLYNQFLRMK